MTVLELFAETHRLRRTRDAYGRRIIAGRGGSLIAEHGASRLSVLVMERSARRWNRRRDRCVDVGCRVEQYGDTEGSLSFDPANRAACVAAITVAGCRRRRVSVEPSEAQQAARAQFAAMARTTSTTTKRAAPAATTDDRHAGHHLDAQAIA